MDYNVTIRIASLSSQVNTNKYYLIDTTFNGIPHSICLYCHIPYLVASWFQRGISPCYLMLISLLTGCLYLHITLYTTS